MIFFSHEWAAEEYHSKSFTTLNYAYSDTVTAFHLGLFVKGALVRSIYEHEGERQISHGAPLPQEEQYPNADDLTFALIDEMLGASFGKIDLASTSFRCRKIIYNANHSRDLDAAKSKSLLEATPDSTDPTSKEHEEALKMLTDSMLKLEKRINEERNAGINENFKTKKWWTFWK